MNEKKYVLAKDTPTADKGSRVEITSKNIYAKNKNHQLFSLNIIEDKLEEEISRLLKEGWIEEVKPLEIWVNEYKSEDGREFFGTYQYQNFEEAKEDGEGNKRYLRTIRFIEATEKA